MDRVRGRIIPSWLKLVGIGAGPADNGQVPSSSIAPERQRQLQIALRTLDPAGNNVHSLGPLIFTLIAKTLPGKRLVRLDLLSVENGKTFTSPRISTPDGSYAFSRKMEITPVLQHDWSRLGLTGEPGFVASMQAINTRQVVESREGARLFLARPLLGAEDRVLGAMVMANQTADGLSLMTPEDKEIFGMIVKHVSELLAQK